MAISQVDVELHDSAPVYSVRRFGDEVIRPSRLGFVLTDGSQLTSNFKIVAVRAQLAR